MSAAAGTSASTLGPLVTEVEVVASTRLSPSFVRLELGGPGLADLGVDGPLLDQRVKLVLPPPGGMGVRCDADLLVRWRELPVSLRGRMRTYTLRDVVGSGEATRMVVDVVVHAEGPVGPGAAFALEAAVGDRVVVLGPRRGVPFGGIEFAPDAASPLLLVGDESAVPAVAGILRDLPPEARGRVFLEVPWVGDVQHLPLPAGVLLTWFARGEAEVGTMLLPAVREYAGLPVEDHGPRDAVSPDLWETPTWSSSGQSAGTGEHGGRGARAVGVEEPGRDLRGTYAWVAGECAMVTGLRRALVREAGMDRRQVAFMGYWRRGVAMGD